jgi:hypothetical protein
VTAFLDVVLYSLVELYRRFRYVYCLRRQGYDWETEIKYEISISFYETTRLNTAEDNFILAAAKTWNLTKCIAAL